MKKVFGNRMALKTFQAFTQMFLNIVLGLLLCVSVLANIYQGLNPKVIMQPSFLVTELTEMDYVTNGKLKQTEIEKFTELYLGWTENLTPDNAKERVKKTFKFFSQDRGFYKKETAKLNRRAKQINSSNYIQTFFPSTINTDKFGLITIDGLRVKTSGDIVINRIRKRIKIFYKFTTSNGIEITNITETKR